MASENTIREAAIICGLLSQFIDRAASANYDTAILAEKYVIQLLKGTSDPREDAVAVAASNLLLGRASDNA